MASLANSLLGCLERAFIFNPSAYAAGRWKLPQLKFEDVWFQAEDGVQLHGWYAAAPKPKGYLLYAHGNAGNISDRTNLLRLLREELGFSVMMFDYRGYGRSKGKPSVEGILKDGRAAREWLCQRENLSPSQVTLMGNSIGAAVAAHLAALSGAHALILEGAFSSLLDVARYAYPWLPAQSLLRQDIDVHQLIRHYKGPLLQSHGTRDRVVPFRLGTKVFEAANEPKEFLVLTGLDHNDTPSSLYHECLKEFLEPLCREAGEAHTAV